MTPFKAFVFFTLFIAYSMFLVSFTLVVYKIPTNQKANNTKDCKTHIITEDVLNGQRRVCRTFNDGKDKTFKVCTY